VKKSIIYLFIPLIIFFVGFPRISYGQKLTQIENLPKFDIKPYHFGFALCINKMDFAIHPSPNYKDSLLVIKSIPEWGFNIGIISNLRLNNYADLRFVPTLSFGERILNYTLNNDTSVIQTSKKIESTFIDFPLLLKYKSKRLNNVRAYVIAGAQYSIDLASQAKKKDKINDLVKLEQNDFLYQVGVGFDFYLVYFKFATELKMSYGVHDLLKHDNTIYTNSIDKLNSKIFQLSFLFE
jgi:hypothetical protein